MALLAIRMASLFLRTKLSSWRPAYCVCIQALRKKRWTFPWRRCILNKTKIYADMRYMKVLKNISSLVGASRFTYRKLKRSFVAMS